MKDPNQTVNELHNEKLCFTMKQSSTCTSKYKLMS